MRTKAAKAAEQALKFRKQMEGQDDTMSVTSNTPSKATPGMASSTKKTAGLNDTAASAFGTGDDSKKLRDLEKKVTKLRNENQTLSQQVDKATRLLEREIGEVVDIDQLSKDESSWKGRA